MKKIEQLKQIKKLLTLALVGSMTLSFSGCGYSNKQEESTQISTEATTEDTIAGPTEASEISNEVIDQIINQYKNNNDNSVTTHDFKVDEYKNPMYVWSYLDNNSDKQYVYDYNLSGSNDNYNYINCDNSTMYVVKVNTHQNNENWYIPISALLDNNGEIVNVKVTTRDENGTDHKPLDKYIYIENPTKEDFKKIKEGQQYLNIINEESLNDVNSLILSKNN